MVGCPAKNVKTLILTEDEHLARKLVFVLSYFIRCSQIYERSLKVTDNPESRPVKYRLYKNKQPRSEDQPCRTVNMTQFCKSNSSPTMEPKISKSSATMKKSKSFISALSELDTSDMEPQQQPSSEKVNFLIGENEDLSLNPEFATECLEEDLETGLSSLNLSDDSMMITKGVPVSMKEEDADYDTDFIDITEVPLSILEVTKSAPASLPSLVCCSDQYMPGKDHIIQDCQMSDVNASSQYSF